MSGAGAELVARIWARDPTVWTGRDEARWLGWLDEPVRRRQDAESLMRLAGELADGLDTVVLFGMGGSSLAPEVLRRAFVGERFHVLDTTHPRVVAALASSIDLEHTLFIASSKSGSTLETRSHADFFWKLAPRGRQWVAITDPGSPLEALAEERGFAGVVAGEPTIGGRYSALSPFGLLPAALVGADLERLLDRACEMAEACRLDDGNPGLELGLALGEGWREGRDKICVPDGNGFGLWVEQLLAESTGKQGKGLVPAPGESSQGEDRQEHELRLAEPYELAQEFFRWEFATAVAATILAIDPFDQPDVQAAKDRTNEVLASGSASLDPISSPAELFARARPGDYVCIQAFIEPSAASDARIARLADTARESTGCVVTHGYGPRYLHSTGQLHKGGADIGLFLQVVEDYGPELSIPGREFGFGQLIRAQAAGDLAALSERGRRVARVDLTEVE